MLSYVIKAYDALDNPRVDGYVIAEMIEELGDVKVSVKTVEGEKGSTDFLRVVIEGEGGKTLGIIGRLGGVGARPSRIGIVSDADGAIVAISVAMKLARMKELGERIPGDVIVATHVCPEAPTQPHDPVPFMGSPVDIATMNKYEVDPRMEAILSVDATKGNRVANFRGFGITPTVKEGWILKVSEDLLDVMSWVTGRAPKVIPITMQDITPYGNGIYHINSIVQPSTVTSAPVVGVGTTAEIPVPGCSTGANYLVDLEEASRFCLEVAKGFGEGKIKFYDPEEFEKLVSMYGDMKRLQKLP